MTLQSTCGNLLSREVSTVAASCARAIVTLGRKAAVMVSGKGLVTVETGVDVLDADYVGTYEASTGELDLWRIIAEDLMHELATRNFAGIKRVR